MRTAFFCGFDLMGARLASFPRIELKVKTVLGLSNVSVAFVFSSLKVIFQICRLAGAAAIEEIRHIKKSGSNV
jgi:hypothetical protein